MIGRTDLASDELVLSAGTVEALVGRELGVSAWHDVVQADIDLFAEVTGDHQFIHVDPVRAVAESPFGGTIAHGFLTLSLLTTFARTGLPPYRDRRMGVNYGLDRVRFVAPVRSGSQVRGRFVLAEVRRRAASEFLLRYGVTVEIAETEKPALVADWLTVAIFADGD